MIDSVKNRRSLTPRMGTPSAEADAHGMRRGGARREVTERVYLAGENLKTREGWALNVSRGGVRIILEERVELGEEYEVTIGLDETKALSPKARVVWLQEEPDGFIVGMEFLFKVSESQSLPMMSADSQVPPPPKTEE